MPAKEFFKGTTHAGRTLVLFSETVAYDTFVDATGATVANPSETRVTATLDGTPIEVESMNWSGNAATVRSGDLGTFTATSTDYAEDHSTALRQYLEHRPAAGYDVTIVSKGTVGDHASYTVSITNGRLTERAEFRLSPQAMQTLARGAAVPTDEQVRRELSQKLRREKWEKIKKRTESPSIIMWLAHPS